MAEKFKAVLYEKGYNQESPYLSLKDLSNWLYYHYSPTHSSLIFSKDNLSPQSSTLQILIYDEYNRLIQEDETELISYLLTPKVDSEGDRWGRRGFYRRRTPYYFTFRYDPVPGIHNYHRCYRMYRTVKLNFKYHASMQEYVSLLPSDSRMRTQIEIAKSSWGWERQRNYSRCWKNKKSKKQWMKNL